MELLEKRTLMSTVKIPVLLFHEILPSGASGASMNEAQFTRVLKALADNNFQSISLEQYYQWRKGTGSLPAHPVILAFDDGNATDVRAAELMSDVVATNGTHHSYKAVSYTHLTLPTNREV